MFYHHQYNDQVNQGLPKDVKTVGRLKKKGSGSFVTYHVRFIL